MLNENEWVVYPGVGLYKVSSAVEIRGMRFIRLVSETNPVVLIPSGSEESAIVRRLCTPNDLSTAFRILRAPIRQDLPKKLPSLERILVSKFKSGSIFEIAEMVKTLYCFKKYRKLSVNEMRFLDLGMKQVVDETAVVEGISREDAQKKILSALN